jgi:hypothetical protein
MTPSTNECMFTPKFQKERSTEIPRDTQNTYSLFRKGARLNPKPMTSNAGIKNNEC